MALPADIVIWQGGPMTLLGAPVLWQCGPMALAVLP